MLLVDFVKESVMALESLYPETEARSIVLMLCEDILGTERYTHIVEPQYQIDEKKLPLLSAAMERLRAGEPIQYVLARRISTGAGSMLLQTCLSLVPRLNSCAVMPSKRLPEYPE